MIAARTTALVKVGLSAVLEGARLAEAARGAVAIAHKGSLRDIVTQTDLEISWALTEQLMAAGWAVISEEDSALAPLPDAFWVIDPIDGTVNFSHGLAQYAISAGWVERGECRLGIVCAPVLDELYFTLSPERAFLNGKPFRHVHRAWDEALLAASFAAKAEASQYALFQQVNESTRGCLRTGSAALNLCWTAIGRLQGAYGIKAKLWDVAGGLAIAQAAGCEIVIRQQPGALVLDYYVGSQDVVGRLVSLAQAHGLWEEMC
jgi:myo-inositol-1(or 4)-monophosphatase